MKDLRRALDGVGAVVHDDRLQEHRAVGRRAGRCTTRKNVSKSFHPTASIISIDTSLSYRPVEVAVVLLQHGHAVLQPGGIARAPPRASCCSREIVVVVTRQPRVAAACIAKPPQPVPISSTWSSGPSASLSQIMSNLATDGLLQRQSAASSKTALEYIMVGSSISAEQLVAEVVVGLDVPARAARRVATGTRRGRAGTARGSASRGGAGVQAARVARADADHRDQVRRVPEAVAVGLGHAAAAAAGACVQARGSRIVTVASGAASRRRSCASAPSTIVRRPVVDAAAGGRGRSGGRRRSVTTVWAPWVGGGSGRA